MSDIQTATARTAETRLQGELTPILNSVVISGRGDLNRLESIDQGGAHGYD